MIQMSELLSGNTFEDQPQTTQDNLNKLLTMINVVRTKWGKPMTCTSGLRTPEHQIEIYKQKAAAAGKAFDQSKVPMASKHLYGEAVDIFDPGLAMTAWLKADPQLLEDFGMYCELGNSDWVHFQIAPFGSYKPGGTRWFNP